MTEREFAVEVICKLRAAGHTALFAGGCVRDLLAGRPSKDFDVATTARPDDVRKIFGHRRTLAVGASFGVIVVLGPRGVGPVEVATFRTEGNYLDGRRPESVAFCGPEEDARRRDFTINGMFFDPIDNKVLDFVNGQADLKAGIVRAIGEPHDRIREDKLRMLRAVRFAATMDFSLDSVTADAIRQLSSELIVVSAERTGQEFKKMLVDRHRRRAIELTQDLQLLRVILPELDSLQLRPEWDLTLRQVELLQQTSFEVALASLLKSLPANPVVGTIGRRLKLSNDETERIVWLVAHQADLAEAQSLTLSALKRALAHPFRDDLLKMFKSQLIATSASLEPVEFCEQFLAKTPADVLNPTPLLTGDDLIKLGFRPGPRFKSILETIRDAQLNLQLSNRDAAIAMAIAEWNE